MSIAVFLALAVAVLPVPVALAQSDSFVPQFERFEFQIGIPAPQMPRPPQQDPMAFCGAQQPADAAIMHLQIELMAAESSAFGFDSAADPYFQHWKSVYETSIERLSEVDCIEWQVFDDYVAAMNEPRSMGLETYTILKNTLNIFREYEPAPRSPIEIYAAPPVEGQSIQWSYVSTWAEVEQAMAEAQRYRFYPIVLSETPVEVVEIELLEEVDEGPTFVETVNFFGTRLVAAVTFDGEPDPDDLWVEVITLTPTGEEEPRRLPLEPEPWFFGEGEGEAGPGTVTYRSAPFTLWPDELAPLPPPDYQVDP